MTPHNEPPGFLDFGWQSWLVLGGFVVVVVLFLGPGMWSSSTEPLWTPVWRSLRAAFKRPSEPEVPPAPPKGPPPPPEA